MPTANIGIAANRRASRDRGAQAVRGIQGIGAAVARADAESLGAIKGAVLAFDFAGVDEN